LNGNGGRRERGVRRDEGCGGLKEIWEEIPGGCDGERKGIPKVVCVLGRLKSGI
jgi:hypothetical protein